MICKRFSSTAFIKKIPGNSDIKHLYLIASENLNEKLQNIQMKCDTHDNNILFIPVFLTSLVNRKTVYALI